MRPFSCITCYLHELMNVLYLIAIYMHNPFLYQHLLYNSSCYKPEIVKPLQWRVVL
jgi:hypothetical protein